MCNRNQPPVISRITGRRLDEHLPKPIERKRMLYRSDVEYADFAMNHVFGCSHGCRYPCYAYLMAKRFGKVSCIAEWERPRLVSNTLELLDREILRLKDRIGSVHLCFTTDPFMFGRADIEDMSIAAISKLNSAGIPCSVLTKGVLPPALAEQPAVNDYGITLVSVDESYREEAEPGAAPYSDRIAALRHLHDRGHKTWVSMEPYPTPNIHKQKLTDVLEAIQFVDRIVFGMARYRRQISEYCDWYAERAGEVLSWCTAHGIECHIKKGTGEAPDAPSGKTHRARQPTNPRAETD